MKVQKFWENKTNGFSFAGKGTEIGLGSRIVRKAKQSIFIKIGALFLTALLLVAAFLLFFSDWYFQGTTETLSHRIRSQTDVSLQLSVSDKFDEYAAVMYQVVTDTTLRGHLKDLNEGSTPSASRTVHLMEEIFYGYTNHNQDILGFTLVTPDGAWALYDSTNWKFPKNLWEPDLESGAFDAMIGRAQEERQVRFIADSRHPDGNSFFHVVLNIWDYYTSENMGTLIMTVDVAGLWRLIGSMAAEEYAFDFLLHGDGRLLVHPDYTKVGAEVDGYSFDPERLELIRTKEGPQNPGDIWRIPADAEIQVKPLDKYDIYLVSVLDNQMYRDLARKQAQNAGIAIAAIALTAIYIFIHLLRRQTQDINAVIDGIQQMRDGRMDVHIETTTKDEIYDIAQTFNASLKSLEIITQQRDREMRRFLQESERRRKAEVRSLQSQINSHFLYNTLNVINYAALEGDTRTTSSMIKNLADCLHYTLNQNLQTVQLRQEIEWLEKYLQLQKERQPSLFEYTIDVAGEILDLPIQKLIIQPFVENAIVHGFYGSQPHRQLYVGFRKLENPDRLAISICDDGVGMEPEKLAEIQNLLNDYGKADGLGIGIENSCFRISTYYSDAARIFVRSWPELGTKFNIVLPLKLQAGGETDGLTGGQTTGAHNYMEQERGQKP